MDWTPDDVRDGADAIERFGFDGDRNDAIDLSQYLLAAVAPQIAARARGHWWITDGPLRLAKSTKLLGP